MKMEGDDKPKEIDIKDCTCYYFGDMIKIEDFDLDNILIGEILYEIFQFITFHAKISLLNLCILDSIK